MDETWQGTAKRVGIGAEIDELLAIPANRPASGCVVRRFQALIRELNAARSVGGTKTVEHSFHP